MYIAWTHIPHEITIPLGIIVITSFVKLTIVMFLVEIPFHKLARKAFRVD
jgi:hypothetical protein